MITETDSMITIEVNKLCFNFLNSGDLFKATYKNIMINQLLTNAIDGSLNNIYLRLHYNGRIKAYPLLGIKSNSKISFSDTQMVANGSVRGIDYKVTFTLTEKGIWFWDITISGEDADIDVIYGQDLGLGDVGFVRSNEAYASQYIDNTVFERNNKGFVVCSRQNQPQSSGFPYIQQGGLTKVIGYSTDGFQFYGLSYKETDIPEALTKESLDNEIYQYEFAYTALQSKRIHLNGKAQFVFYGLFKENHEDAIRSLEFEEDILKAWDEVNAKVQKPKPIKKASRTSIIAEPLKTMSMTKEDINQFFPNRHQEEFHDEKLLSFFTETHEHVVLKEKELLMERPHGHILISGKNVSKPECAFATTSYMYGVFNSQLVVGNTLFNKMISNTRNPLNIIKTSGQRIFVSVNGSYHQLTMPSMFEMGFNYARWYYKTADDIIIVTNFTTIDSPEVHLNVRSNSGKAYRFIVTNQITMNNNEFDVPYHFNIDGDILSFTADENSDSGQVYPNLRYRLHVTGADVKIDDETALITDSKANVNSLVVLRLGSTCEWNMIIQGLLQGEEIPFVERDFNIEKKKYREMYSRMMNGFKLTLKGEVTDELNKINDLAWWFTHDMLIHYTSPHGLEQYGGAAWGTRDVCQGPAEYFLATQKYKIVRHIIKTVYSHQFVENGDWPQWFMFDNYSKIQASESHGDIIVWPLKVLSDYLAATKDFSLLEEKVAYTESTHFNPTEEKATILDHLKKAIENIKANFLYDTYLSSYGNGDWDDTLQPANAQLKQFMVSSWTVALTYQVFQSLSQTLVDVDNEITKELQRLAEGIRHDFQRIILGSGVIPGFVYLEDPDNPEFMLHPTDTKTGISYRLLPMNRGIISELFTPEQAKKHYQIIKENLSFPDGVRLMNHPTIYTGGVSKHFKRAEQASNFGREIGLQYVHAHIRFVEAMAKLGKADEVWHGLEIINPVGIQKVVPNAEVRQSNAYFSSSDGNFKTRYEAQERFDDLRDGAITVKGGWRIYSSGPGIYMNQLISNALGIRQLAGDLVIDPILPKKLNGLSLEYQFMELPITFVYHLNGKDKKVLINNEEVATESIENRYRHGGVRISRQILESKLKDDVNVIDIYM